MLFFLVLSSSSWVWIWCSWRTRLLCLSYQSALWVVCNANGDGLLSSLSFPGRRGGLRASQSACVCVFVGIYAHYTETAQTLTQIRNIIVKLFCICLGVWSANCQLHCFFMHAEISEMVLGIGLGLWLCSFCICTRWVC